MTPAERVIVAKRRLAERPHFVSAATHSALLAAPAVQRRARMLGAVRRDILRDARARAAHGQLKGPVRRVRCDVTRDDADYARANPAAPLLRYDCLAITFSTPTTQLGQEYQARVDFAHAKYAWCLFTPVGGEGAHSAVTFAVTPSPACVGPVR